MSDDLIRRARHLAERAVTANGSRATFVSDTYFELADTLESSRAEVERLREALTDLQACERVYRTSHDVHGGDAIITGRAWDKMRKSGDRARSILDPKQA